MKTQTPIVFIIFNRPDVTEKVFNVIRQVQPSKLLVIADAPRQNRPDDEKDCAATRKIIERVDWDCEVLKNYADTNLGIKLRISSGLNWVFDIVEEAIILEDDCLPELSFFPFCEELLKKYQNDDRIMTISGNNFQFGRKRTEYSYYFSRYTLIWGWATWRRAWQKYDVEMKHWDSVRNHNWLHDILDDSRTVKYWSSLFQGCYEGSINSWALPWTFTSWIQNTLSILPNVNLVSNIGFSPNASHTRDTCNPLANYPTESIEFPLQHPPFIIRDRLADQFTQQTQFDIDIKLRFKRKFQRVLKQISL
ncbi:MAG: glycosyltransferase family 2 protein [Cyanomargarita calcarea GSE-NOS-MK-12-04C]|jgi:hypothetical protein|uniref:Glycosyltransferase family 2 protein n=1 Tax=Cyanomargarita calcarea GSE-NOS-MK-12-04C TaxID=2839659 RepID=A0A951QU42_9CYAN|nr:glycosyltransferase family 2 protein [Cyanomargarita calcarea GSE-NOS-MK-12-04C]